MPLLTELGNCFHRILQRCRPCWGWAFALASGRMIEHWRYPDIVLGEAVSVCRKRQRAGAIQKLAPGPGTRMDEREVSWSAAVLCRFPAWHWVELGSAPVPGRVLVMNSFVLKGRNPNSRG